MVGDQARWREDIFVACPLRDLVPEDHILRRVDRVLDLGWLRAEVADCYCLENGGRASTRRRRSADAGGFLCRDRA